MGRHSDSKDVPGPVEQPGKRRRYIAVASASAAAVAVAIVAVITLGGAGKAAPAPAASPSASPYTAPEAAPAPSPTPDLEMTVCADFTAQIMPTVAKAASEGIGAGVPNPPYAWAQRVLMRDDRKLSHWAYLITTAANEGDLSDPDAPLFANYLGDAGLDLAIVGNPYSTAAQAQQAAVAVGEVNGYCKYDAS
jgi:ABC-type transport system substrate-binding protein